MPTFFSTNTDITCSDSIPACNNVKNAKTKLDTVLQQSADVDLLYARELIYGVNMTVGIGLLILYIYYNK